MNMEDFFTNFLNLMVYVKLFSGPKNRSKKGNRLKGFTTANCCGTMALLNKC